LIGGEHIYSTAAERSAVCPRCGKVGETAAKPGRQAGKEEAAEAEAQAEMPQRLTTEWR
jgi:hypothetical protein